MARHFSLRAFRTPTAAALAPAVVSLAVAFGEERDTAAIAGLVAKPNASRFAEPASFRSLPAGWRQFDDGGVLLNRRGGVSETFATSWAFDRSARRGPAGDIPPGGVIVSVLLLRRAEGGRAAPELCRGLAPRPAYPRIRDSALRMPDAPVGTLEGDEAVAGYRIRGTVRNDYHVEIRIDVKDSDPDRELIQRAQDALKELRLPNWPNRCW